MKTYNKLKNELNLHHCTEEHTNDRIKNVIRKAIAEKEEEKISLNSQSKTTWYNGNKHMRGQCNEYLKYTNKFKARCILMYKTKMLPLRCNTK